MNEKLNEIIMLMEERGYDPIAQLTGYLEIGSDDYITRHGNAREKIKAIDKEVIKKYIDVDENAICEKMSKASDTYGDGFACKRIADILENN